MEKKKSIKRIIYIILGCIGVVLGAIGAILPMIPAFPFLMMATVCFGKSSDKLDKWFKGTELYKNNLESFVKGQGMTWKTKIRVMVMVTLLMSFGFFIMFGKKLYIPCVILGFVWLFHILYFCFGVKKYVPRSA
ncbi:MAG: YbaN family protein [Erysipelotrichaceae bacterium]